LADEFGREVSVWAAEAINTAFELLCDVASPEFHPLVEGGQGYRRGRRPHLRHRRGNHRAARPRTTVGCRFTLELTGSSRSGVFDADDGAASRELVPLAEAAGAGVDLTGRLVEQEHRARGRKRRREQNELTLPR
jgi:hypothetical protein